MLGSGSVEHAERAEPLGRMLAELGVHLLCGGGAGVMEAVARGFCSVESRRGLAIGVLPGDEDGRAPRGYPNPWIELPIRTHLPYSGDRGTDVASRNHINVLSPACSIALPGSAGTVSEVRLARRYGRPVVAYLQAPGELVGIPDDVPILAHEDGVRMWVEDHLHA